MAVKIIRGFDMAAGGHRRLPPRVPGPYKDVHCMPLATAAHGSAHLLQPPTGGQPMPFFWDAQFHNWITARRRSFPFHYLASHGWAYVGPLPVSA